MELYADLKRELVKARLKLLEETFSRLMEHDLFVFNSGVGQGLKQAIEIINEFEKAIEKELR